MSKKKDQDITIEDVVEIVKAEIFGTIAEACSQLSEAFTEVISGEVSDDEDEEDVNDDDDVREDDEEEDDDEDDEDDEEEDDDDDVREDDEEEDDDDDVREDDEEDDDDEDDEDDEDEDDDDEDDEVPEKHKRKELLDMKTKELKKLAEAWDLRPGGNKETLVTKILKAQKRA